MNNGLLVIERLILESLIKKEKTIFELEEDTKVSVQMLSNVLPGLIYNHYIKFERGYYRINTLTMESWLPKVNASNQVKEEVKELFGSLVNEYFSNSLKDGLKMKKIWLTNSEEVIFKSILSNLESFIENIRLDRKRNPKREVTGDQKVIFWGFSEYSKLVDGVMAAV